MEQYKIVNAYAITDSLSNSKDLTIAAKWALYSLRKDLSPHNSFYTEESRKLIEKYNGCYITEANTIRFEDNEKATEFRKEYNALDNFDVDLDIKKYTLKLSDIPDITIKQIETLENFIEFIPE